MNLCRKLVNCHISTHAPLAGRDSRFSVFQTMIRVFQPTRPLRGATSDVGGVSRWPVFQPTRPLRGATILGTALHTGIEISTHAPLAGRDVSTMLLITPISPFQPTRPLRGATLTNPKTFKWFFISTHAPLAGRDDIQPVERKALDQISTHAPLAGRDAFRHLAKYMMGIFQPTRPLRGATWSGGFPSFKAVNFNPRAPCGARRFHLLSNKHHDTISTHAPLAGRDSG